jgi:hypothetical protein
VIFLVPHSSDQTQPPDLIIFALLKQGFSSSRFNRLATPQSNQVLRILGAWFAASAPHHNIEAFTDVGLIPVERNGDVYLSVQPENARTVRGHPPDAGEIPPAPLPPEAVARIRLPNGREQPRSTTWRSSNNVRQRIVKKGWSAGRAGSDDGEGR